MQQNKATPIPLVFLVSGNLLLMRVCSYITDHQFENGHTPILQFCDDSLSSVSVSMRVFLPSVHVRRGWLCLSVCL